MFILFSSSINIITTYFFVKINFNFLDVSLFFVSPLIYRGKTNGEFINFQKNVKNIPNVFIFILKHSE